MFLAPTELIGESRDRHAHESRKTPKKNSLEEGVRGTPKTASTWEDQGQLSNRYLIQRFQSIVSCF